MKLDGVQYIRIVISLGRTEHLHEQIGARTLLQHYHGLISWKNHYPGLPIGMLQ